MLSKAKLKRQRRREERRTIIFCYCHAAGTCGGGPRQEVSPLVAAASVGDPFAKGLTGPSWLVHSLSLYLPSTMNNDSKEHGHDIAILSSWGNTTKSQPRKKKKKKTMESMIVRSTVLYPKNE